MWFSSFMRGRYGNDNFNRFLLIVALVMIVVDLFVRWRILDVATVLILIYVYCRMFSRNIYARQRENQKFLELTARFRSRKSNVGGYNSYGGGASGGFGFAKGRDPDHKVFRCPSCGERLRVPKGAGTIMIKCPICDTKFKKKV